VLSELKKLYFLETPWLNVKILLLSVLAVAMIGLMVPSAFAEDVRDCNLECVPEDYEFGKDKKKDLDVILCLDKWWTGKAAGLMCKSHTQYEVMNAKHVEFTNLWHSSIIPEFYPMEPFFKQFTDEDVFCLLESPYTECVGDNGRPLVETNMDYTAAYAILYQGCHSTARNLMASGEMTNSEASYVFEVCKPYASHLLELGTLSSYSIDDGTFSGESSLVISPETKSMQTPEENSMSQLNSEPEPIPQESSQGGGCLIATAAFGSEMAPQVQFLRELRDNTVLQTQSGTTFMNGFNQFYYSFSPAVADYERENPVFKEMVKVTLTPLLTSLTLLNYVDVDTEEEMLGYGIGIILLNVGMYFVAPAVLIISLRKHFHSVEK